LALDFLKHIVTDGFLAPPTSHQPIHLVDTLLETWSDNTGSKQHQEFQTRLLVELMNHFVAVNILDHRALQVSCGGDPVNLPPNLVYLATRIVDKLWQVSQSSGLSHTPMCCRRLSIGS
uniref:MMS22L_N domain-containing protein n=1 Tax=Echinostoma caproni TaxID=27848 RepID=A0A183BBA3_9TREM